MPHLLQPFHLKNLTKLAILRDCMHHRIFCIALQPRQSWQKRVAEYDTFDPHDFTEYDHHHDLLTSALHYTSTVLKMPYILDFLFLNRFFFGLPHSLYSKKVLPRFLPLLDYQNMSISISIF